MSKKSSILLKEYKSRTGLDNIRLGRLFDVDQKSIGKYLKGHPIQGKIAKRMEQITSGELKAIELLDLESHSQ